MAIGRAVFISAHVLCWLGCASAQQRDILLEPDAGVTRKALLIGNQNYQKQKLVNPIHDAVDLGERLKRLGFAVHIELDATQNRIHQSTREFVKRLAPGDTAVFYFSGHGFQADGENYLVPIDIQAQTVEQVKSTAVAFSGIKTSLERSPAGVTIMILDSCRNNPFVGKGAAQAQGLALLEAGLGAYVAFAASPGQTASDNAGERNGLFTKYLLQSLEEPLHVAELFRKVRQSVYQASGGKQRPYVHDQVISNYYLSKTAKPAGAPPPKTRAEVEEAKRLYHQAKCDEAVAILEKAARTDPTNPYTQNALGMAFRCAGLMQEAVRTFSVAIENAPGFAPAYLNRGQVFLESAQYEMALRDFDWAIEQEPESAAPLARRGSTLLAMRRYEDARTAFTMGIERDPTLTEAFFGRAQVAYQLGQFDRALADIDTAIYQRSRQAAYWQLRARVRDRLGDRAGAAADRAETARLERTTGR